MITRDTESVLARDLDLFKSITSSVVVLSLPVDMSVSMTVAVGIRFTWIAYRQRP